MLPVQLKGHDNVFLVLAEKHVKPEKQTNAATIYKDLYAAIYYNFVLGFSYSLTLLLPVPEQFVHFSHVNMHTGGLKIA